jgi:segregation and condensation protein B
MNPPSLKSIVEAIIFASETPLNAGDILEIWRRVRSEDILPTEEPHDGEAADKVASPEEQLAQAQQAEEEKLGRSDIQKIIDQLVTEYEANPDRGFVLVNVAQGFQFRTRLEAAPYLRAMNKISPTKLSQAALETLSIVAYRQPIIRAEIDQIRGVDSGGVLKTLMDRDLVRIVGKKDEPGKPLLYGTTEAFLQVFNLRSLQDLPTLKDLNQIEEEMKRQHASQTEMTPLDGEFFEEDAAETSEEDLTLRFGELEKEEEEAFEELEAEIRELKGLEEKVLGTLSPSSNPTPDSPPSEGEPVPGNPESQS